MGWGVHDYPNPPDWNEPERELPECPVCGKKAETFYRNEDFEIIGCEFCIHPVNYDEMEDYQ